MNPRAPAAACHRSSHGRIVAPLLLLALLLVSACASRPVPGVQTPAQAAREAGPSALERSNRRVLAFNQQVNRIVIDPLLTVYRFLVPPFARKGVANVTDLAGSPWVLVNDILQGEGQRAATTAGRIVVNATLGLGGLFEVAEGLGLPDHDEDFGQTLAVWGVPDGAFLIVPLLGPTTVRDGIGLGVGVFANPVSIALTETGQETANWALTGASAVVLLDASFDALQGLEESSLDFYAALESAYRQARAAEIRNGAADPDALFNDPLEALDPPAPTEPPPIP